MKQAVVLLVVIWVAGMACAVQKNVNTLPYDFPAAMTEPVRAAYVKQCEEGKRLYVANCAKCHNTTVKGKETIPDFSMAQLIGYELRVLNPKHEMNITETAVNAEELGLIMTFLTYKTRNK